MAAQVPSPPPVPLLEATDLPYARLLSPQKHGLALSRPRYPPHHHTQPRHETLLHPNRTHPPRRFRFQTDHTHQNHLLLHRQPHPPNPGRHRTIERHLSTSHPQPPRQQAFHAGIAVEPNTYRTLLKSLKSTEYIKQERESCDLQTLLTFPLKQTLIGTAFSLGRRNAKNQTQFFDRLLDANLQNSKMEEIRRTLKENLYVKPIPRLHTPKHSINELRKIETTNNSYLHKRHHTIQIGQHKRNQQIIQSNQLSNAFTLNTQLKLNDIKKFPIHCSPSKIQATRLPRNPPSLRPQGPKLQIKRQTTLKETNNVIKSTKDWNGIVAEMKQKLYKGVKTANNQQSSKQNYDEQIDLLQKYTRQQQISEHDGAPIIIQTQNVKFRKLNLINSSNINIQADSDHQESEVFALAKKNYSLFQIKDRKSQLFCSSTRKRMNFWEKGRISAITSDLKI